MIIAYYTAFFHNSKDAKSKLDEILAKLEGKTGDMDDMALYNAIKGIHSDLGGD